MTAQEIVDRVNAGETVRIPTKYVRTFMQQCDAHWINCSVYMQPEPNGVHALTKSRPPDPTPSP